MKCAECNQKECSSGKDCTAYADEIKEMFAPDLDIMRAASHIESSYYKQKTRLQETVLFSQKMGYHKLGLAFCIGLSEEARKVREVLKDFEVVSVCCKVCGIDKDDFNLEKIENQEFEASCNPIGQATILNKEKTEFNIVLGLCIGHDTLFYKHSEAPVTTLAVKDRVLAHNPLGAIYSAYY